MPLNVLNRLLNCRLTRPRRPIVRQPLTFLPGVESLEEVLAPANFVTTSFASGTLNIIAGADTGLAADDKQAVIVTQVGNIITVANAAGGVVGSTAFTNVKNLNVNLRGDDDTLTLSKLRISGLLNINMGNAVATDATVLAGPTVVGSLNYAQLAADDTFVTGDPLFVNGSATFAHGNGKGVTVLGPTTSILGNLTATHGIGDDVFVAGAEVRVGGNVNLSYGNGDGSTPAASTTVFTKLSARNVAITSGNGADVVVIGGNLNATGFAVNHGQGKSTVVLGGGAINVTGPVSVTSLDGDDVFILGAAGLANNTRGISVNHGTGASTTILSGIINVNGNVNVTTGAGGAHVQVFDGDTTVTGAVTINNGTAPTNTTVFGKSAKVGSVAIKNNFAVNTFTTGDSFIANGLFSYTGAGDTDTVTFAAGTTVSARGMNLVMGEGTNTAVIGTLAGVAAIDGPFNYTGGSGVDLLVAGGEFDVNGPVTVNVFDGDDTVILGEAATSSTITGNVAINLGAGADTTVLSNISIRGNLAIDGGAGTDTAVLAAPVDVSGNLSWRGGDGDTDAFTATGVLAVLGTTNLDGGAGDGDTVTFAVPADVTFGGLVTFNGGLGLTDTVTQAGAIYLGGVSITGFETVA